MLTTATPAVAKKDNTPSPAPARKAALPAGYAAGKAATQPQSSAKSATSSDPYTVVGSDDHFEITPKKPNGKTLYFFFGYKNTEKDIGMRASETSAVEDSVYGAARRGFKVVYDKGGTKAEFLAAVYDPDCFGIYWSGHGYMNGGIQASDSASIGPADIATPSVSKNLQYLILAACGTGVDQAGWQKALGPKVQFQGWVPTTTASEANDFQTEAFLGDSASSHNGTNPDKEMRHYVADAEAAKKQ